MECHRSNPLSVPSMEPPVISSSSPLENLISFALVFLIGALWGHLRCGNREARRKGQAA